jgi:hypothetical protein
VDTETAIETVIEPQLVHHFGQQTANVLLTRATLCYVTITGTEQKKFDAFVDTICSEESVQAAWDRETLSKREKSWKALLECDPDLAEYTETEKEGVVCPRKS